MQRWEYDLVEFTTRDLVAVRRELDSMGAEGWELVSVMWSQGGDLVRAALKRPLPAAEPEGGSMFEGVRVKPEGWVKP